MEKIFNPFSTIALEIDLAVFGNKLPNVFNDYLGLAILHKVQNNSSEELKYLNIVYDPINKSLGDDHELTQIIKKRIEELKNS